MMSGTSNDIDQTKPQSSDGAGKITCHLVSLPKVLLHRIDEKTIESYKKTTMSPKKHVKRLAPKPSRFLTSQSPVGKNSEKNNVKTPNKSLKKENNFAFKSTKLQKKTIGGKLEAMSKAVTKGSPKDATKMHNSPVKNMLNKTMLQKKSKIAIPPPKKSKSLTSKSPKPTPPKPKISTPNKSFKKSLTPKIKIDTPSVKSVADSGDESLYDDLMNQIESTHNKKNEVLSRTERTTNITLKPNTGNKPPTVVKGGIIKKTNLPADLKPVTTPNNSKETKDLNSTPKETSKSKTTRRNIRTPRKSLSPTPAKKPSPWPIAISSPVKDNPQTNPIKPNKKLGPKSKITSSAENLTPKLTQKTTKPSVLTPPSTSPRSSELDAKPISFNAGKHKMGPKKTATVIPQLKSPDVDDNLSDEYTEEERLEMDVDPVETIKMTNTPSKFDNSAVENTKKDSPVKKPTPSSYDISKDDEDPHLDLLRILTDESEEPAHVPAPQNTKQSTIKPSPIKDVDSVVTVEESNNDDSMDSSIIEQVNEPSVNGDVEPPVRTIYDLMNEISLQYPSWNLHIMPESNAFCIAQVTKGRLGLPTLKKCIELDPNDYNAKVYIHQYHIKRFDGVYDSEESIVALIEEINSIKA